MRRIKRFRQMDSGACWFLIVVCGFIGTVFTFGMHYWHAPVAREDAQQVSAIYASYELDYGRNHKGKRSNTLNQVYLRFADREKLSIDSACVDAALLDSLSSLSAGTTVEMLIHPNSDSVLSLRTAGTELLSFDTAMAGLTGEKTGFLLLGLFMYLGAATGAYYLIAGKTY